MADDLYSTTFAGDTIATEGTGIASVSVATSTSSLLTSDLAADLLVPNTQMNENWTGWTTTFTFTATENLSLTDLTHGFQFVTASGTRHGNSHDKAGTAVVTLTCDSGTFTISDWGFSRPDADKDSGGGTPTADVSTMSFADAVSIAADETFTLASNAVAAGTGGTYLGLSEMAVSGTVVTEGTTGAIPEPTTATLSLLALAGLVARRRRK